MHLELKGSKLIQQNGHTIDRDIEQLVAQPSQPAKMPVWIAADFHQFLVSANDAAFIEIFTHFGFFVV